MEWNEMKCQTVFLRCGARDSDLTHLRDDGKTPLYLVSCWSCESNPSRTLPIALLMIVRGSVERVSIHSNRHTQIQLPCPYLGPKTLVRTSLGWASLVLRVLVVAVVVSFV